MTPDTQHKLYEYLHENFGIIATQSEMQEIENILRDDIGRPAFNAARKEKKWVVDGIGHFMVRKYTDYNEYKRQNP